jgi:hypothetical protein
LQLVLDVQFRMVLAGHDQRGLGNVQRALLTEQYG